MDLCIEHDWGFDPVCNSWQCLRCAVTVSKIELLAVVFSFDQPLSLLFETLNKIVENRTT